jgi:hypothetical protein
VPLAVFPLTFNDDAIDVQLNVAPDTADEGLNETAPDEQIVWVFPVLVINGSGSQVTVKLYGVIPLQPEGPTGVIT